MQLDKLDMSDPATVIAVVAIGVLGLGMCVQLVFLFATLLKSDSSGVRKSGRARRVSTRLDGHITPTKPKKTTGKTPKSSKTPKAATNATDLTSPTRRSARTKTPAKNAWSA